MASHRATGYRLHQRGSVDSPVRVVMRQSIGLVTLIGEAQTPRIGNQTGGRVFLFLYTDDFDRDFESLKAKGIVFVREPKVESYGTVAVFKDLYGNLWDLLQRK
jgi:uncharacterized glyoxalase superfamily protein PhnB